jgi:hypothetical protein
MPLGRDSQNAAATGYDLAILFSCARVEHNNSWHFGSLVQAIYWLALFIGAGISLAGQPPHKQWALQTI